MAKRKTRDHRYLFKASWRATALRIVVDADDLEDAYRIAETMIKRMQGGVMCMDLTCIKQEW